MTSAVDLLRAKHEPDPSLQFAIAQITDEDIALAGERLSEDDLVALSALDDDLVALAITPGGREGDDSPFSSSKTSNWVARAGGLPTYIREVAHAMVRKGKSVSEAIGFAVGIVRNWAEGKGKGVSAKVKAAAAAAIAEWEKKRASSHAKKG